MLFFNFIILLLDPDRMAGSEKVGSVTSLVKTTINNVIRFDFRLSGCCMVILYCMYSTVSNSNNSLLNSTVFKLEDSKYVVECVCTLYEYLYSYSLLNIQVAGLYGNFNGDPINDYEFRNGTQAAFGRSSR